MASICDLHTDVLFKHVFDYLATSDVWKLRLTCRKMNDLCWDYFEHACGSLWICSTDEEEKEEKKLIDKTSCVSFGAGLNILRVSNCKHLQEVKILGRCSDIEERIFLEFTTLLTKREIKIKTFTLSDLDLSCIISLVDSLSHRCVKLEELKLIRIVMPWTVQRFLQTLLMHSRNTLHVLQLKSLTVALNDPLPTESLTVLQRFSVRWFVHVSLVVFVAIIAKPILGLLILYLSNTECQCGTYSLSVSSSSLEVLLCA